MRPLRTAGIYWALLAAALLVNVAGYLFSLWHEETAFDEAVHFYTSFATVAALGHRWAIQGLHLRGCPWKLIAAAVLIGVAWELFEWGVGIIGTTRDTLVDLIMDLLGGTAAAVLICKARAESC